MKIEKFKKRPNGLYTIYLDDFNSYDFYEEIILKYELLITKNIEKDELTKIIEDNKNYAKSYVHNAIITTNKGPRKIEEELVKKGVASDDYLLALEEYNTSLEKEKIEKLISKKIKSNHNKSAKVLKQKLQLDLNNNGFSKDIIKEILNSTTIEENNDIAKKEYEKYYKKLSKKYSGKELEYKLKQKMYSLGFNIEKE